MGSVMDIKNNLVSVIQTLTSKGYNITSVFDIGANKGKWTAFYEIRIPNASFILFEANPHHQRPVTLKQKHKWFNAVLSSPETKEVDFYSIDGTGDSYYKEATKHYKNCMPIKLPTSTLDTMATEHSLPLPQLVKLDTQGAELDILSGGSAVINHADIVVMETPVLPYNQGAPSFDDYINFMVKCGFVPIGVDDIQFANGMFSHLDIVFLKKNIKNKYYGDNHLFTEEFKI